MTKGQAEAVSPVHETKEADLDTRGKATSASPESGSAEPPSAWHAFLSTLEHILDSRARTERAQQLLNPVLAAAVLTVLSLVAIVVLVAASWSFLLLGGAGIGTAAGIVRRRRASRRNRPSMTDGPA